MLALRASHDRVQPVRNNTASGRDGRPRRYQYLRLGLLVVPRRLRRVVLRLLLLLAVSTCAHSVARDPEGERFKKGGYTRLENLIMELSPIGTYLPGRLAARRRLAAIGTILESFYQSFLPCHQHTARNSGKHTRHRHVLPPQRRDVEGRRFPESTPSILRAHGGQEVPGAWVSGDVGQAIHCYATPKRAIRSDAARPRRAND